jgi:hypothetical protein
LKPLAQQNLYEILDVPFDASTAAIAEAVERAQALYAPGSLATYTLMDPEEEKLLLRLIEEARVTLLDPAARARYDERITGPDQPEAAPASPSAPASAAVDAAIRVAWPELPPVIPAAPAHPDEEWEEDLPVPPVFPAGAAPEPTQAAQAPSTVAPIPEEAPAASRPVPILLNREVSAPPPLPAATPVPVIPPAAPQVPAIAEGTTWSGEVLRKLREARGISLQQISERTKVTRHHIENIEADRFEQLPASVYLRGILLSIARELRLDGQKVARSYLERVAAACSSTSPIPRPR